MKRLQKLKEEMDLGKKLNYKFNKPVFWIALIFLIIPVIVITAKYGLATGVYYCCPKDALYCDNIFYTCAEYTFNPDPACETINKYSNDSLSSIPQIKGGECLGDAPPYHLKKYPLYMLSVLALAFLINHLINKRDDE